MRVIIFHSDAYIRRYFFMSRLLGKSVRHELKVRSSESLLIDPTGRTVKTKKGIESQYYANLLQHLDRNRTVIVTEGLKQSPGDFDANIPDYNLALAASWKGLDAQEKKLLELIRSVRSKIESTRIFTADEMQNISISLQQFFIRYRVWHRILENVSVKTAYLWPHYHREGCIHALREKAIRIVELQHGLIAPEDIFYVLPERVKPISKRALFADEIWVYGKFWKEQLLKGAGYDDEQIKVAGYFPLSAETDQARADELTAKYSGKKIILITTQTFLSHYFCEYTRFLAESLKDNKDYHIVVKPHPAEKLSDYASISDLPNVEIVNETLELLFQYATVNISIYSTTLFDGLRAGVPGVALWYERFSDYLGFFQSSGVVRVVQPDENPMNYLSTSEQNPDIEYYYEKFHPEIINAHGKG